LNEFQVHSAIGKLEKIDGVHDQVNNILIFSQYYYSLYTSAILKVWQIKLSSPFPELFSRHIFLQATATQSSMLRERSFS
jgi:hypothetical protein